MKSYTQFLASSTKGAQIFLMLTSVGTCFAFYNYGISFETIILIIFGYFLYGCLGIVVTFHRYLTHKSYETNPYIIKILSILGCFSGTGSPMAWVAIHINHHLKSDTLEDPHSPLHKGIKIFTLDYVNELTSATKWRMRHLITDKFQQYLHRYYFLINIIYSLLLFSIGGFYLMIFFHWAPATLTALMSNVVNYVGHSPSFLGSSRSYNLNDRSTNNWLWAIPSWGESWHNNHHRYPKRSYLGDRWYQVDISGLIIHMIKR